MKLSLDEFSAFATQTEFLGMLRGKRIFLSGGTGFFGKWLLESFLYLNAGFQLGSHLTILSRHPDTFLASSPSVKKEKAVQWVEGDVRTFDFPEGKFDFVIHAATEASSKLERENPEEMYSVIVEGTRRVLDFAAKAGVSRLMLTSSGAVYGTYPTEMSHIPESYEGMPVTSYGKGKLRAEQLCVEAGERSGFSVLLPRCFAFVGPYLNLDIHFAIGNFIRDCLEDRPIVIRGDGTPLRSYLYAADLTEWLWTILLKGVHGRPYNVGSDQAVSIRDLALLVRECSGREKEVVVEGKPVQGALPVSYVPLINRAVSELGLSVRVSLSEAVKRTFEWYSAQRP